MAIGGYSGKRVEIVQPTEPFEGDSANAPRCALGRYRMWLPTALRISDRVVAQGGGSRWQANILDVDETRLVIAVTDFPGTTPEDRAELDAIVDSIEIEP